MLACLEEIKLIGVMDESLYTGVTATALCALDHSILA